jgi:two-component system, OmpR family, phosphate regulon sensor histidine kinase PhoR
MTLLGLNLFWLVGLALVAGVASRRRRRRRERVRLLVQQAEALATGDAEPNLPPPLTGGLGDLQIHLRRAAAAHRQRLEEARAAQRRLEEVLGGMIEGVLVIDAAGTVQLSNRRAEALLDLPHGDLPLGRPLIELTRHPDLHELVREVMGDGGAQRPFVRDLHLDGAKPIVLQVTATPMPTLVGGRRSFILVFHDVSETKRLERIRRDFVANVSHELRTPLAAIGGYAETLLSGALDDPQRARRFLAIIERHTVRLGRLVDDLLTLSDLELGRTELRRVALQADDVVETTFEVLRNKAVQAGIVLSRDMAPDTPPLDADEDRLEQALVNLVDNAIKYTPHGGHVTVSARGVNAARPSEGGPLPESDGFVEIAVSDTGIGVPPEDLPRLTERFYRVDKARSRELGGTGLGLAIVKHIIQAHGGWMRIESELGRGTTVHLYLPRFSRGDGAVSA